jgi:hypothetical protein
MTFPLLFVEVNEVRLCTWRSPSFIPCLHTFVRCSLFAFLRWCLTTLPSAVKQFIMALPIYVSCIHTHLCLSQSIMLCQNVKRSDVVGPFRFGAVGRAVQHSPHLSLATPLDVRPKVTQSPRGV